MNYLHRQGDILVRPFVMDDAESLYRAVRSSVASLSYWLPWCHDDYSRDDASRWVSYCLSCWDSRSAFPMGVFNAAGDVIGGAGISQISRAHAMGNIGYWVCDSARNAGVATTAARASALFGFNVLGLTRLEIVVLPHNVASHRVAEKLGAVREVEARNRVLFQGRPAAAVVYSLIPDDMTDRETSAA